MDIVKNLRELKDSISDDVALVAVSKTKPSEMIKDVYQTGHFDFGENKVQELVAKQEILPDDIRWHMIGHLQSNKVKYISPFIHLIHSVDSLKLLKTINKEGRKNERVIQCLFQLHIAEEDSKFGLDESELIQILNSEEYQQMEHVKVRGLMGMATFTENFDRVRSEFRNLKRIFDTMNSKFFAGSDDFNILSMGMSQDFNTALEEGSNMIRVGSLIFGERNYK